MSGAPATVMEGAGARNAGGLWRMLFAELSPNARRLRVSIRTAFIAAIGAALMAALQIDSGFGAFTLFRILAQHSAAFTVEVTALLIAVAGVAEALSLVLAGILVQLPIVELPFFGFSAAAGSYVLQVLGLGSSWLMILIGFLSTFLTITASPDSAGWKTAYAFAGLAVGYLVLFAFDNFLWPERAEAGLIESLADRLERKRRKLKLAAELYLERGPAALPEPPVYSMLKTHLDLLARANHEQRDPHRRAMLLAAVTQGEQIHHEVERLVFLSREPAGDGLRGALAPALKETLAAFDAILALDVDYLAAGIAEPGEDGGAVQRERCNAAIDAALAALDRRAADLIGPGAAGGASAEAVNLGAFITSLHRLKKVVERTPAEMVPPRAVTARPAANRIRPGAALGLGEDPLRIRHGLKIGLACVIALIVALVAETPQLEVIIWTVLTVGPPTYGGALRKMALRVAGGAIGGLLAIPAIIVVSPNFTSLAAYAMTLFLVLAALAYVANSTQRIAYGGLQAGVSFMIAIVGLQPSIHVSEPLWRVWGILIGLAISAAVFLTIWPEYAGQALAVRLNKFIRAVLELLPAPGNPAPNHERVRTVQMFISRTHQEILEVADDARLEGQRSGIDDGAVIDAAGALLRIGYRMAGVMAARAGAADALARPLRAVRDEFEAALRLKLERWLAYLERAGAGGRRSAPAAPEMPAGEPLDGQLERLMDAASAAAPGSWPGAAARVQFLADLEAYRRIASIAHSLDDAFARVRRPAAAAQIAAQAR